MSAINSNLNDKIVIKVFVSLSLISLIGIITYMITNNVLYTVAVIGAAYMAINIGANDVANNVGPAFGAGAFKIGTALIIAAIFEASGAIIAGGDVVSTIKKGIIDPSFIEDTNTFIWLMTAALIAAAIWLNIATKVGAPVSTTHSIVGAVMGAGIAAGGFEIVSWVTMGKIAASWFISPILGGLIAAAFLHFIKWSIVYKDDNIKEAKKKIPILIAVMSWAITTYLVLKGFKKIWIHISEFLPLVEVAKKPDFITASLIGLTVALIVYIYVKPKIEKSAEKVENNKDGINKLFIIPLIFAAAALCFAHGANDVANAIGPLAAIVDAFDNGTVAKKAAIPLWVMLIGAGGIVVGLGFFGGRIIRKVGQEIITMTPIRAFSIAMGSTITVIIATQLGLPVSSTHIAVGGVFAVGFLREYYNRRDAQIAEQQRRVADEKERLENLSSEVDELRSQENLKKPLLRRFVKVQEDICKVQSLYKEDKTDLQRLKEEKKNLRKELKMIALAWVVTVPVAAFIAAMIFFMIRGIML